MKHIKTIKTEKMRKSKSDLAYMQNLCKSAETLIKDNKNAIFWIGGDLNLPDIDWNLNAVQGHQYIKTINDEFLQFLQDNTLQQIVTKPTRNNNILDLFITNRPTLLNRFEIIPGISDHGIVYVDTNIVPHRQRPTKRKIYLWKK